jgi:hypothetical protein
MGLDAVVFARTGGGPALELRLGNVAQIAHIRELLLRAGADPNGVLLFCVWSGSHSGDEISFERIADMKREIDTLYKVREPALRAFLDNLSALADAAQANENPICFV